MNKDSEYNQKYNCGNGKGKLNWNITKLLSNIDFLNKKIFKCHIDILPSIKDLQINRNHVDEVDIKNPIIIVKLDIYKQWVIDGNHRIYKAKKTGVNSLNAYLIEKSEHIKFIEGYDEQLYREVIEELPKLIYIKEKL